MKRGGLGLGLVEVRFGVGERGGEDEGVGVGGGDCAVEVED